FLRRTCLLVTVSEFVVGALPLTLILTVRAAGASSTAVGAMFGLSGCGGIVGSIVAARAAARVMLHRAVVGVNVGSACLVPFLAATTSCVVIGLIYGR